MRRVEKAVVKEKLMKARDDLLERKSNFYMLFVFGQCH